MPGKPLTPPLTFTSKQPLVVNGKPYRGKIRVLGDGKTLQVIDVLGLEAYLKGVVPAEMPSAWSPEALKAQAVAARSYALANLAKGKDYDLYADTRSQVYGGLDAEVPATNDAVDATKGEVVLYNGKVANTLFFSTSGGRTASAAETTGIAVPYLVSVADPYDTASPYHDWGPVLFDAAKVAKQLKLPAPLADLRMTTGPSGRAKSVTALTRRRPPGDAHGLAAAHAARAALDVVHARAARPRPRREDDHLRRRRLADRLRARHGRRVAGSEDRRHRTGRRSATCCSTAKGRSRPS